MLPTVYWVETPLAGRLAVMPRPRAGDWLADEVAGWKTAGIDLVVSLLEPQEVAELGLQGEAHLCDQHTIEFVSFPVPDRGVPPSRRAVLTLAYLLASRISHSKAVAVHCRDRTLVGYCGICAHLPGHDPGPRTLHDLESAGH